MIVIGCDHAGFDLKEKIKDFLVENNEDLKDVGAFIYDKEDDFSKFALKMREEFKKDNFIKIIAVCGSGVGMNIALNKCKGIRCVLGHDINEVRLAREHNNVNALALSGKTNFENAKNMVVYFLTTAKLNTEKYIRRMSEIEID